MIYGYDLALLFPVQSLYDTGMINMYVNAMQRDYERGLADQKEFVTKYGDFTSPFAKDIESWDKATVGAYRDLIDNMQQQGIDPLRSQQGRAMIQNFIMGRPYADLAKLKQSAKVGEAYNTLLAKGVADGTLDYNTAMELDPRFKDWDTLRDGTWLKTSPTSQKSVNQLLAPYIEDLQKGGYEYDKAASAATGYKYRVKTVSDQKIKDQLGKAAADIMRDPMMQLRVQKSGLTPEEYIQTELYNHMRTQLAPREETDEYTKARYEQNLRDASAADRAKTAHEYRMEEIAAKGNNPGSRSGNRSGGSGGSGNTVDGYSVSGDMHKQANERVTTVDFRAQAANNVANGKFKKYLVKGKLPNNILNSSAYQNAVLKEENRLRLKAQTDKVHAYAKHKNYRTGSMALATEVGEKAIYSVPGIGGLDGIADKSNGNYTGNVTIPAGKEVTIGMISQRNGTIRPGVIRADAKDKNKYVVNSKPVNTKIKSSGKNFIQQIESDGRVHWYFALANGHWYDAGVYEESQQMEEMDKTYLNFTNQSTKAIATPFDESDYSDIDGYTPPDVYDDILNED